ncbi:MAG: hypothetical protein U1E16_01530 [Hyphomicrobiales bacterium]
MCINIDSQKPEDIITGAVGQSWEVEIKGRASPCRPRSRQGHLGDAGRRAGPRQCPPRRLVRQDRDGQRQGHVNVGIFGGKDGKAAGDAANVVTDYVWMKARRAAAGRPSPRPWRKPSRPPSRRAKQAVKATDGATAEVNFSHVKAYPPFNLAADAPAVSRICRHQGGAGLTPIWCSRRAVSMPTGSTGCSPP